MATRKKKPAKIKFEVTRSGIGGIGVVCFCIFLWMFLIGVWVGQSLLRPSHKPEGVQTQYATIPQQQVTSLQDSKKNKP